MSNLILLTSAWPRFYHQKQLGEPVEKSQNEQQEEELVEAKAEHQSGGQALERERERERV